MKKALGLLVFCFLFMFAINFTVKAETYQANELELWPNEWIRVNAGDVLEFGTGTAYDSYHFIHGYYNYSKVGIYRAGGRKLATLNQGDSFVFDIDCLVWNNGTRTIDSSKELFICTGFTRAYFYTSDETKPFDERLQIKEGETKRLNLHVDSVVPTSIIIVGYRTGITSNLHDFWYVHEEISKDVNYVDIPYGKYGSVMACINCEGYPNDGFPTSDADSAIVEIGIDNIASNTNEKDDFIDNDEPQTPSELPYGTVKCGNGGKGNGGKDAIDIKVLTPESRDTSNQNAFAKNYFKNRSFSTIFSYNVYPPYGVNNGYKNSTRIIYWADTGLKQGDEVYAVWYCQSSKKGAQMIKCDIDANGIVSIRIPQIGDMSTITLIKVK